MQSQVLTQDVKEQLNQKAIQAQPDQEEKVCQCALSESHSQHLASDMRTRQTLYQVVMFAVARSGDHSVCRALFLDMETKVIPADKGHYTALMMSCAPASDADTA
mmetsp:Transcript_43385/g.76870  ORF Transcript_43385/g.76870 Transcript_43385/m.76870 type:complete len:105 (+) Transcript_43385:213-527(+)